ncbi:hypothetical protein [Erythrobacter litoralis]|uniref:Uncharacterized protein n=1 Tax=Erythrobacter litoralis (strain HTCC2594) TaxID=314225 RepID=Q2ND02_ERYLH|nr:hypothetical protein [Erythrobacter litoralis]ABC62439.1 hypothetical protein ELI_01735 [Erythrobacter litoralis HTCC2594]
MNLLPTRLRPAEGAAIVAPKNRAKAETVHRLQVGLLGLAAMILLVGVADMIMDRAQQTEAAVPPAAAPTVEPSPTPTQNKALENAGVVPDLPADAEATPLPEGPVVPEQGDALPGE